MAIRTPRPRPVSEPTLIGGLARVIPEEQERRRILRLEDRERSRRERFEQLQFQGEEARQGIEFQTFLRNVRGEEIVGGGGPVPGTVTDFSTALQPRQSLGQFAEGAPPDALAPRPGSLTGLEGGQQPAGAVGATRRRQQAQRRGAILEPARATRPQFQESEIRRLDPDRDPTQLVRREAPSPNLGFASIEQRLDLPPNALEEAFRQNAPATLRLILEDSLGEGGGGKLNREELNDLRLVINSRVQAIQVQMEATLDARDPRTDALRQQLREELDELTVGLIQASVGSPDFSQEDAADEIDRLFPDDNDEQKAERLISAMRAAGQAADFARRARGALTPRR